MVNDDNKPVGVLSVLRDASRMRRVAITCRCGQRWVEIVPHEVHDSSMICQFECDKCHTLYHLKDKQLTRVKEDASHELERAIQYSINTDRRYDA